MGVELHVRSGILALLVARVLQRTLSTACVPPVNEIYLDHVDPVPDDAVWSTGSEVATLRLPLAVYAVPRTELLAHPDQEPPGASTPAGRAVLVIEVSVMGGALALRVVEVGGVPDDLQAAVVSLIGSPPVIDVGGILAALGVDTSTGGRVELVDDLVVARFGDTTGPAAPVTHRFEWGLFLDAHSVERVIAARIPKSIPPLQSVTTSVRWDPHSSVMVRATIRGPVEVPDQATLRVEVSLGCALSVPLPKPEMRIDVGYSLDFDTGLLAFSPSLALAVEAAEDVVRAMVSPETFGGVRTGEATFAITMPLPEIRLAGEPWRYEGMVAGLDGVVIGGAVGLPVDVSHIRLSSHGSRFSGSNFRSLYCSRGDPQTDVPLAHLFSTVADVTYQDGGRLCEVEVIPAGAGLESHLTLPGVVPLSGGVRPGSGRVFMQFGVETANTVNEPIKLILRTSRGVRCHHLGQPEHFTVLPDGTVDGAVVMWFDDCNKLPPDFGEMTPEEYERWSGVIWYSYWGLVPGRDYNPDEPPILPDTLEEIPADWSEIDLDPAITIVDEVKLIVVDVAQEFGVNRLDTTGRAVTEGSPGGDVIDATAEGSTVDELQQAIALDTDGP